MADFLDGPQSYTFPLWKGQDTAFIVKRQDPDTGAEVDYDAGTVAKVVFNAGTDSEIEFEATVDGCNAQFIIDDSEVLSVKSNSKWRLQFTVNGADRTPVIGKVVRKDA